MDHELEQKKTITLPKSVIKFIETEAKKERRPVKNYIEKIVLEYIDKMNQLKEEGINNA